MKRYPWLRNGGGMVSARLTWAWSGHDCDARLTFIPRVPPDTARRALARRRRDQMAELRRMMRTLREWEVR